MKRYAAYKDSGVEWLGEIPAHWEVKKLKYNSKINMGQSPPSDSYNYVGVGIPFIQGSGDFGEKFPKPQTWCAEANKITQINDVLISVRAPIGEVNIADQIIGIGRGICAIMPIHTDFNFLFYYISILSDYLNSIGTGSIYVAISLDDIRNVFIPLPPLTEQIFIAHFLDRKTSQIDSLVEKKKRLIELLKEEKTAVINQAVTKGLNPNVKMKDSGVEWLGEIPEHWEVKKLKWVAEIQNGYAFKSEFFAENGAVILRIGDIQSPLNLDQSKKTTELIPSDDFKVKKGDTLIALSGATVGKMCYVENDIEAYINQRVARIASESYWLFCVLNSDFFVKQIWLKAGGSAQDNISTNDIGNFIIPVPNEAERVLIEKFVNKTRTKIDSTISKIEKEIELLQEYRTALISEVVTGKVRVE